MKSTLTRQLIILPLLAAVLAMLHACGSASAVGRPAAAPQPFAQTYVLTQGASVAIAPAAAPGISGATAGAPSLKLERVNDSRCRVGAVCVWAGYISYSFALTAADGTTSNFVLSDSMPNARPSVTQNGLTFTLTGVEPQAVPAKNEATPDYRVSLRVSNAPSS
ncbi:hypothetical protein D0T25_08125 [Duganella sp. BJB488]|uniref:hypothetical protein n=1 Tax=unclassified Duganella TaxID=2636909 RepID=UPI000E34A03F|nr:MULTISPECIES: hypothetical protein [unclassified Duganella]NVD70183.1 hypothetical protein [Duganella sp. BJB1802]RFP22916.1 hypothetical protein D0T26_07725 [Duganella sp. BJB489]RFP25008.1 hypothetical protein D0T25_08125 [Duganella sp. BJB488]RFP33915.1 hypothetical protein D0T24_16105 [Duganella sp. BJB480]